MWWPDVGRLVDEEAVARAERGDGACCRAHEEAAGQASMRRWRLAKQGGGGRGVCARGLAVRENVAGTIQKLKKRLGGFQTHL
jgi:hypothetical protein